ncbi:MAG: class I SAM-dependent methyltransferase [Patescibacteria group bacterium]|jgi:SAM-dependent methyltransferase
MSDWSEYYAAGLELDSYIRNLYGQREFLAEIVATNSQKILEVGAGTGAMSIFLSQLGLDVTTLDNDPAVLKGAEKARQEFGGHNQIVAGDAFKLPFPDNSFDLIFHQGLLEHFTNVQIQQLLDEQLRVAPLVILSVPNANYPRRDFGNERLLRKKDWENVLRPYQVKMNRDYALKIFPKWYLVRVPIQYMAKIGRT